MKIDVVGASSTYEVTKILDSLAKQNISSEFVDPRTVSYIISNNEIKCFINNKEYEVPTAIIVRGGFTGTLRDSGRLFLNYLSLIGVLILDKPEVVFKDLDKVYQSMALCSKGLPHPKTLYKIGFNDTNSLINENIVIKPNIGSKGRGISKVQSLSKDLDDDCFSQEFRGKPGEDIRVIMINGKVVGGMKRSNSNGEWRSNIALGSNGSLFEVNSFLANICKKAQEATDMFFCGIDILEDGNEYIILEVNRAPQFKEFEKVTGINISKMLVEEVLNETSNK